MHAKTTYFLSGILLLSGCLDFGYEPPPVIDDSPPVFTATFDTIHIADSELLRAAYSSFKIPQGFYQEDLQDGSLYYENTLSIVPVHRRSPPYFELSTNSRQQALAWSESTSVNSAYYRVPQDERETDQFFEFRRVYQVNQRDITLSRVHKLSYFDRSMYDFWHPTPLIGRLNSRPLDESLVQRFTEYFWFINNYATWRMKALTAIPTSSSDTVYCALYHLRFTPGDFGVRDLISLERTTYAVSKSTGDVITRNSTLRYISGLLHPP